MKVLVFLPRILQDNMSASVLPKASSGLYSLLFLSAKAVSVFGDKSKPNQLCLSGKCPICLFPQTQALSGGKVTSHFWQFKGISRNVDVWEPRRLHEGNGSIVQELNGYSAPRLLSLTLSSMYCISIKT